MTVQDSCLKCLGFDNVELKKLSSDMIEILPKYSEIKSRDDVNLWIDGENYYPIFSSPMKYISEPELVIELGYLGGIGILHRFFDSQEARHQAVEKIGEYTYDFGVSIGINNFEDELAYVDFAVKHGANKIVIDVASGHNQSTFNAVAELYDFRKNHNFDFDIISGNVVTQEGSEFLARAGCDIVRVSIGSGALCSTSNMTGIGCPTLTALQECAKAKDKYPNLKLIMDGGIRNSGDAVKAFVFGADFVMVGSLFGNAKETNNTKGEIMGMSSYDLQRQMGKRIKSNEGIVKKIDPKNVRPLKDIYEEFCYGIKSGLSYLGVDDINDLHDYKIEYVVVDNGTLKTL